MIGLRKLFIMQMKNVAYLSSNLALEYLNIYETGYAIGDNCCYL